MKATRDGLEFSTGKTVYANRGIVGLCLSDDEEDARSLFYGYDGGINIPGDDWADPKSRLTPEECVELADAMLEKWAEFRRRFAPKA